MKYKIFIYCAFIVLALSTSCGDFLDEVNYSSETTDSYLNSQEKFDEMVTGAYAAMKPLSQVRDLAFMGTDIFTHQEFVAGNENPINTYSPNIDAQGSDYLNLWIGCYYGIARCNEAIKASKIDYPGSDAAFIATRVAEVKALRAWCYFLLVEQFGDIPLVNENQEGIVNNLERKSEVTIYLSIISNLEAAIQDLDYYSNEDQFGRVNKGVAEHLLAKIYLTRGYKSYGNGEADFTKACTLADNVIDNGGYRLLDTYAEVVDFNNQMNDEIIFSIGWDADNSTNNDDDKSLKQNFCKFNYEIFPGMAMSNELDEGKYNLDMPTNYFYELLLNDADSRDEAINRRLIASNEAEDGFEIGDTVIYFPKEAWSQDRIDNAPFTVVNPGHYLDKKFYTNSIIHPMFQRFDDPVSVWGNSGTRDVNIFRLAGTYLLAAEAYLQKNDVAKATEYVNVVRQRAAYDGMENDMLLTEDVDLDGILDERARELAGEDLRWYDLKRTGKLIERVKLHNEHAAYANNISEIHLLRPIPQSQIDLSEGALTQNPGY